MKRGVFPYLLTLFLLTLFVALVYWIFGDGIFRRGAAFLSPLPDFLTVSKNNQVRSLDVFLPVLKDALATDEKPSVSANAGLAFDLTTGQTLFAKNEKIKLPMASLTKIMTAIIALENKKSDNRYVVSKKDLVGENSMGLIPGEILSLDELLYGLILVSGNDAAEVFATNHEGGRASFIQAMNDKVKALGLSDTHFTNPSGLEGDGDQYTTAYDLLIITNYALKTFPTFKEVVNTVRKTIPQTPTHQWFQLENETNLLTSYPGVKGVKTGFTNEAGYCLVTYLDYKGHEIIGILLGSSNRRQEMKDVLDYSLRSLGVEPPKHK